MPTKFIAVLGLAGSLTAAKADSHAAGVLMLRDSRNLTEKS
jgi:hypothetical protein